MSATDWICHGCGTANSANDLTCVVCGAEPGRFEPEPEERYGSPPPEPAAPTAAARPPKTVAKPRKPAPEVSSPSFGAEHHPVPLTDAQRRGPARLTKLGFFLTLFCCLPIGPIVASVGHSQMRRRPEAVQARGWAWASYVVALLFTMAIAGALIALNSQSSPYEGTWRGPSAVGDVQLDLHQTALGTSIEGTFFLSNDRADCSGALENAKFEDGSLSIHMRGNCSNGEFISNDLVLYRTGPALSGFGAARLERTDR